MIGVGLDMKKYNLLLVWCLLLIILFSPSVVNANSGATPDAYLDENRNPIGQADPDDLETSPPSSGSANSGANGGSTAGGFGNGSAGQTDDDEGCTYSFSTGSTAGNVTIKVVDGNLDYSFSSISGQYNITLNASATHLNVADFENECPSRDTLVFACTASGQTRQCSINTRTWIDDNIDDPWDNDSDWEQLGEEVDMGDFNNTVDCPDIINMEEGKLGWLLNTLLNYIRIIGPVLVVLLSAIDFIKAVLGTDEKAMKEAQNKLIIRLVAAVALFLVPTLVQLLLSFINASTCTVG